MTAFGRIGFIGGGQMGEALVKGILAAHLVPAEDIMVAEPQQERRNFLEQTYKIQSAADHGPVCAGCTTLILAVKPQIMGPVLDGLKEAVSDNHLLISIAAGIPLRFMEDKLAGRGCRLVRVMPNTPALVQEAASALAAGKSASAADMKLAEQLFQAIGKTVVVDEHLLDAVTGLSGSGPAYVFSFIEGLIDAGVKVGLSRPVAETLVLQTVLGSVKLAIESGQHPAALRAMVTSPGGTTIAGLHAMERAGFRGILMDAVERAADRSRELGGHA